MEAKELRIGNLLTLNDVVRGELWHNQIHAQNDFFEVKTIYIDNNIALMLDDEIVDLSCNEISPIPITEAWLNGFGFFIVHKNNKHFAINDPNGYKDVYRIHIFQTINKTYNISFSDILSGKEISYTPTTKIKYVHQLQNLYFALTGEELELNDNKHNDNENR